MKVKFIYNIIIFLCCSCEMIQNMLPLHNPKADFNFGKPL